MKIKILNVCLPVLSSIIIFFTAYHTFACGWSDDDWGLDGYFIPEQDANVAERPLFFSWLLYYDNTHSDTLETSGTKQNIAEWEAYLNHRLTKSDISILLYQYRDTFSLVQKAVKYNAFDRLSKANRQLAEHLRTVPNYNAVMQYVEYARDLESFFVFDAWDENPIDNKAAQLKIEAGKQFYAKTNDLFLKLRYAFHIQRMCFVVGDYPESERWYQTIQSMKPEGGMKYRSLGYYAGALYHQQRYAESNYYYSIIYDRYAAGKLSAYESFHPWEDTDWDSTLAMAHTPRERDVLWHLFGVYADPLTAMQQIYRTTPSSDLLDLLLVRAICIQEQYQLPTAELVERDSVVHQLWGDEQPVGKTRSSAASVNSLRYEGNFYSLLQFVDSCARLQNTHSVGLWHNAAAYLHLIDHNHDACQYHLHALSQLPEQPVAVQVQAKIISAMEYVFTLETLNSHIEQKVNQHIEQLAASSDVKARNALDAIMNRLATLYAQQHDEVKSILCGGLRLQARFFSSPESVDRFLAFLRRKDLSEYERFIIKRYGLTEQSVVDGQALNYLYNIQFEQAIAKFEEVSDSTRQCLPGNPFNIHIVDCHDCDHQAKQTVHYTVYTFAKKLMEMDKKAESTSNMLEKAQNYLLIGNGLYNMTYYGNARFVHQNALFALQYNFYVGDSLMADDARFYDTRPAMEFYRKAYDCATTPEFKAKCAWMCAKCEHAMNYTNDIIARYSPNADFLVGSYFMLLKDSYSNTKYYKEIISECGYFCTYTGGGGACIRNRDTY